MPPAAALPEREALVTGEAVLLDLRPASFATRMLSYLIDGAIILALSFGLLLATVILGAGYALDPGLIRAGVLLSSITGFLAYPVLTETLLRGRSVGRLATGTRVVRLDGGPVHLRQSLLRAIMAMFEIWATTGVIAVTCALIDPRSRRVGDLLAGTMVVQERMRAPAPVRLEVPESLREWARSADVGRLPAPLLRDIRALLPRADALNPQSRRAISRDLLERTLEHVAPAPPAGTEPEQFLQAVLAERSRRDEVRLRAADARERELAAETRAVPFSS
ncbi:RDD family protein [Brachybacterium sp. JHP9]|uniref:RDD family protein n=1 Tax=Brachybacterium equifaecis TaxID=2910770 RepID=A0ABT0R3U8_9MICO|nr:RDD family protein [Brachybacterium equifaecis]MCL6423949.1 RDD family protein [Brachybacterium equifaecis]